MVTLTSLVVIFVCSMIALVCVAAHNGDDDSDTIVDRDCNTMRYLGDRLKQDKIDCVIVDVRMSRDDDIDRIKDMIAARDIHINNPSIDTAIQYASTQYNAWYAYEHTVL